MRACRELSAQIDADAERRKEMEVIRVGGAYPPLQTPTYHNIYTTLKNNRRITRLQVSKTYLQWILKLSLNCLSVCLSVHSIHTVYIQ